MSKESDECYTPIEIIRALGEFDLDPACGERCKNRTARRRYQTRGLERKWSGRVWLNPPYSEARPWGEKFFEHGDGIMLWFFAMENKWTKQILNRSKAIFMFSNRIQFAKPGGGKFSAPYQFVLFPLGEKNVDAIRRSGLPGNLLITE